MDKLKILLVEENQGKVDEMKDTIRSILKCKGNLQLESVPTYNNEIYDLVLFGYRSINVIHGLSLYDDLTHLYNRKGFFYFLEQHLKVANRYNESFFLVYIDLNRFKNINDTYGHKAGDKVLIDVANILKDSFRNSDIVARTGGDEFAIFPTRCEESIEDIKVRLKTKIRIYSEENNVSISLSVGASKYDPKSPCSADELVHKADVAMYKDKNKEIKV